jgi:hypothetical protein
MTSLKKAVHRITKEAFGHYKRRIVVSLEPGDVLAMRLERMRTRYRAPLSQVFRQMAIWHAELERQRKAQERKSRSKA